MNWIISVLGWFGITSSIAAIKYIMYSVLALALFVGGCSMGSGSIQSKLEKSYNNGFKKGRVEGIIKGYDKGYEHGKDGKRKLVHPELWFEENETG